MHLFNYKMLNGKPRGYKNSEFGPHISLLRLVYQLKKIYIAILFLGIAPRSVVHGTCDCF